MRKNAKPRPRKRYKTPPVAPPAAEPANPPVGHIDPGMKQARNLLALAAGDVEFLYAAIPTMITVSPDGFYLYLETRDRESGEETTLQLRWDLPPPFSSRAHAVGWIYARVREAWVHELNEAMFVDGIRRRDLHREIGGGVTRPPEELEALKIEIDCVKSQLVNFLTNAIEAY